MFMKLLISYIIKSPESSMTGFLSYLICLHKLNNIFCSLASTLRILIHYLIICTQIGHDFMATHPVIINMDYDGMI